MGIADLWPVLSTAAGARVPFPVFLSEFVEKNGRPPRMAIDAYMFMFWSQLPTLEVLDEQVQRRILRNFMAKLWYLVQNNVLFVVVFDGKFKPGKLRHGHIPELPESLSYDEALRYFRTIPSWKYEEGNGLVESLKKILQRNRIDWVQAPAEAEAECAWLQRLGIVDYVVSDDSDTLVFGATKVLRSFNRVKYYDEENEPVLSSSDYYVTPLEMAEITKVTGLTRERLIFIAVLRGGDYSSGSEGIGITRAKELAMCGTTMLLDLPRKLMQDFGSFPDFATIFGNCFVNSDVWTQVLANPYHGIKDELDRSESLLSFTDHLNTFINLDAKNIFGRATKLKEQVKIDDYYAMLYFYPFVNTTLFKFTPSSVSFGELTAVQSDLSVSAPGKFARDNGIFGPGVLGYLNFDDQMQHQFVTEMDLVAEKYSLPRERKYNLRPFALKLVKEPKFWKHIHFVRTKNLEGTKMAVLKFERVNLNEVVYLKKYNKKDFPEHYDLIDYPEGLEQSTTEKLEDPKSNDGEQNPIKISNDEDADTPEEEIEEDDEKMLEVVIPYKMLVYVSKEYATRHQLSPSRKSPKKKLPPQKTTLDSIWSRLPSPTKAAEQTLAQPEEAKSDEKNLNVKLELVKQEIITIDLTQIDDEEPGSSESSLALNKKGAPRENDRSRARSPSPSSAKQKAFPKPRRKSPSRKLKGTLLPGQSKVTSFFQPTTRTKDPQTPLFVSSDEDLGGYEKLQRDLQQMPTLRRGVSFEEEESPSKKPRLNVINISPDASPLKDKFLGDFDIKLPI